MTIDCLENTTHDTWDVKLDVSLVLEIPEQAMCFMSCTFLKEHRLFSSYLWIVNPSTPVCDEASSAHTLVWL